MRRMLRPRRPPAVFGRPKAFSRRRPSADRAFRPPTTVRRWRLTRTLQRSCASGASRLTVPAAHCLGCLRARALRFHLGSAGRPESNGETLALAPGPSMCSRRWSSAAASSSPRNSSSSVPGPDWWSRKPTSTCRSRSCVSCWCRRDRHRLRTRLPVCAAGHGGGTPRRLGTACLPSAVHSSAARSLLEDMQSRLKSTRLLTLIGIGGTGKTRLARKLAERQLGCFADGVVDRPGFDRPCRTDRAGGRAGARLPARRCGCADRSARRPAARPRAAARPRQLRASGRCCGRAGRPAARRGG